MDAQCEKTAAFSLQSIFKKVLKPLDVKTKFYNAEVSVSLTDSSIIQVPLFGNHTVLQVEELTLGHASFIVSFLNTDRLSQDRKVLVPPKKTV